MALYDRLREMQMPLGVGRGNVPPSEPEPRITRPENIFVPPTVAAPAPAPQQTPVFIPPQNQMVGIPTVLPAPAPAPVIPPQVIPAPAPAPVIPPQVIDLGGGLGSVALPQIPVEVIQDIINTQVFPTPAPAPVVAPAPAPVVAPAPAPAIEVPYVPPMPEVEQGIADLLDRITAGGGKPEDFVIYQPPAPPQDEYLRDQEERETGLEDTGVSEEVIEDVVVETPPPVGAIDSVTGEVIPEEDVILTTMPLPQPDVGLPFPSPAPAPVPAPAPAVDVVTGEEMPLITPVVDVPQDSMTGLASYFTAPQIQQIVRPPQQIAGTTDMDKLLQLQRDSFLKFLVQPQQQTPTTYTPPTTTDSTGGISGYLGKQYTPFGGYSGSPYVNPVAEQVQNYMYSQPQAIQFPTNQMYGMPQPLLMGRGPLDETRGSYGDVYGGLVFPDFSGITSLVPYDARQQII